MKKYQKYKPSGVEWISDVPENWELKKLKYITEYKNGVSFKSEDFLKDDGIPVIRIGDVGDTINFNDCVKLPTSFLVKYSEFIIKNGDILVGLTGGTIGKSGRYNYDTPSLLNQRVCILRNKNILENKLLYYYVKSEIFIRYIFFNCYGGGQDNIGKEDIINMILPLPSLNEQKKIVQFLDKKTELIDKLISTKEQKIDLLKHQRTSLIKEVITKGLNSNVEMKDSGIEWIGEIPKHWRVLPLKYFGLITLGKMLTPEEKDGYILKPYLRSQNIQIDKVDISDIKEMWFSDNELQKLRLQKGDLLVNEGGDVGRTSIWNDELEECYFQNSVNRVRFNEKTDSIYYFLYQSHLFHNVGYYSSYVNGVSISHLTKEKLESVRFLRPPFNEQKQITEYLNIRTKEIDELVLMEQNKIDLLKEYRQSLISEVITGKIDVGTTNLN
jgi:type I restriction enzyme S subunit